MINGILAIAGAFFLFKYQEKVVQMTGKFGWAEKYLGFGGTYRALTIISLVAFLWGIASITGTTDVLLSPLSRFAPGGGGQQENVGDMNW